MKQSIIAANWKMHGNQQSLVQLAKTIIENNQNLEQSTEVILIPPYPYLSVIGELLRNNAYKISTNQLKFSLGAQAVSPYKEGAYTGDVAASMLKDLGCQYALIGHSERRHIKGETNAEIAEQFLRLSEQKIATILCVGETWEERKAQMTWRIISEQLHAVLPLLKPETDSLIVAYEPVWAIGTGQTATPEIAAEVHQFIRQQLVEMTAMNYGQSIKILYGGSVKAHNAKELFTTAEVGGVLVGGASLDANEFSGIIQCNRSF